ncbi:Fur-regulated basic protein FbpA [Neobacillus sp. Marseille-QA0830]
MGNILRKAVEERRQKLIDQLIALNVYKKADRQLYELSLSELENEYRELKRTCHPHNSMNAIKWKAKGKRSDS